jgi:hypothetical protein
VAAVGMTYFLIVYNRGDGEVAYIEFDDPDKAAKEYARLERGFRHRDEIEVVLLGADSIETIKQTHSNYFEREDLPFAAAH